MAGEAYAGCWFLVTDLADGFYCSRLHKASRKYLAVRNPEDGQLYRYTRLPMGPVLSPHDFCRKVARMVRRMLETCEEFRVAKYVTNDTDPYLPRVYGVNAAGQPVASLKYYVDDGIIIGPTEQVVRRAYKQLAWVLESRLGMRINRKKTVGPSQRVDFLGMELDSRGDDVGGACTRLPVKRRLRCLEVVRDFTKAHVGRWTASRRELASLAGELLFASNAIPAGRTFLSRVYDCMAEREELERGAPADYDRAVRLTKGLWKDIQWWEQCLEQCECVRRMAYQP